MFAAFHAAREYLMPVLATSQFLEKGVLTPEEFVSAGNFLTRTAPTWKWASGDAVRAKAYLPAGKQFLVTERVPCPRRVSAMESHAHDDNVISAEAEESWEEKEGDEDDVGSSVYEDIESISALRPLPPTPPSADIDSFIDPSLIVHDAAATVSVVGSAVRSYDITIVYDNYYRTPRVYLRGHKEDGSLLTPDEMMEDVMQDYANRTATIETHPHSPDAGAHISIHPCRHAHVMKRILDSMTDKPSVESYIFIFLKFISSIIPTIEYDFTVGVVF